LQLSHALLVGRGCVFGAIEGAEPYGRNGTSAAFIAAAKSSRASRHILSCAENSTSPDRVQPDSSI
jgi:hypothetical protein